ncbi:DUF4340 domain-containing protein [bacterium]|nr:DUF4340 domain-containing protein [bacterium]
MNTKTLLTLAFLLLALASYIFFVEFPEAKKELEQAKNETLEKKIFNRTLSEVDSFTVFNEFLDFTIKNDTTWILTEPVQDFAEVNSVEKILSAFFNGKIERVLPDSTVNFHEVALDTPLVRLKFYFKDGKTDSIALGIGTATKDFVYAKRNAEKEILLIPAASLISARHNLFYFRRKNILSFAPTDADEINVKTPHGTFTIKKDQVWKITSPFTASANQAAVYNTILIRLFSLRVAEFSANNPGKNLAAFGLENPSYTIELKSKGKFLDVLYFGKERESLVFLNTLSQVSVRLADKNFLEIFKDFNFYRDSKLQVFEVEEIDKVRFSYDKIVIELAKENESWFMERPVSKAVTSPNKPQAIFYMLLNTDVENFLEASKENLQKTGFKDEIHVEFWSKGEKFFDTYFWQKENSIYANSKIQNCLGKIKAKLPFLDELKPKISDLVVQ